MTTSTAIKTHKLYYRPSPGSRVAHAIFGIGRVIKNRKGAWPGAVTVNFRRHGIKDFKWYVLKSNGSLRRIVARKGKKPEVRS